MSVIDLGGRAELVDPCGPFKPAAVHVINLESPPDELPDWIRADVADACELPAQLAGHGYDLGFPPTRALGADPVPVLSDRAALALPGDFQYLPLRGARKRYLSTGLWRIPRPAAENDAMHAAMRVELLSQSEMKIYFPDSDIPRASEMMGMVKSLIAAKGRLTLFRLAGHPAHDEDRRVIRADGTPAHSVSR